MVTPDLTITHGHIIIDGMEYVSIEEAGQITGYSEQYLRRIVRCGKIKAQKKGAMWWVELDSLKAYKREMDILDRQKFSPWRDRED